MSRRPVVLFLCLFLLITILPAAWGQEQPAVEQAWQLANAIGRYEFSSTIVQTTRPLPKLVNAGLSPTVEKLYVEGAADTAAETLALKIWSQGGETVSGHGAIEMDVRDGVAFGRVNNSAWHPVEDASTLFAPGQDPLGFLHAAGSMTHIGRERSATGIAYDRYTFSLDAAQYAAYMRDQMEAELQKRGELPSGLRLGVSQNLAQIEGEGEIWLAEDGLPLRQIMHLTLPEESLQQLSAEITTDFTAWGQLPATAAWQFGVADWGVAVRQRAADSVAGLSIGLVTVLLTATLVVHSADRRVYKGVAYSYAFLFFATPLLQANQASQFTVRLANFQAQYGDEAEAAETPLYMSSDSRTNEDTPTNEELFFDDGTDSDDDGISDEQEIRFYGTLPDNDDSDADGLLDGVELLQLGTDPLDSDSDADLLDDLNEVNGYVNSADGREWSLDPRLPDSNYDGEPDGVSCEMDGTGLICVDTDGDLIPDAFDDDDDNDGVPDSIDNSSTTVIGDTTDGLTDNLFKFDLDGLTADQSVFVDLQLRPTNPEHLWYSLSILDWPSNDRSGQILRVHDEPFGASGRDADGDMRLTPLLEVTLTGDTLPLPLTTPRTDVVLAAGTATLEQAGTAVDLTFSLMAGTYDVEIVNDRCGEIDAQTQAIHTFTAVADGTAQVLNNVNLATGLATGTFAMRVTDASASQTCHTIPNIINGPYSEQMVDNAKLADFRIVARELNDSGDVYLLIPLTLVYDEAGNMPHAFGARLFYDPQSADFGDIQSARLLWTIAVKEDFCRETPDDYDPKPSTTGEDDESAAEKRAAWCAKDANWLADGTSIVHTYEDAWYVTGMNVQRNISYEVATVFQDPAFTTARYGANTFNEGPLWTLAQGLDVTYMSGSSEDVSTPDFTLDTIVERWDQDSNSAATEEERFYLPADAFQVERFAYEDASGLGRLSQVDVYTLLENNFTGTAITDPTLLFLQESHIRAMSIDQSDLVSGSDNQRTLNVSDTALKKTLFATLNWTPYQWQGDGWLPYPLTDYWDAKGAQLEAVLAPTFPLDTPHREQEIAGAALLDRVFYFSLLHGSTQLLAIDDEPTDMESQYPVELLLVYLHEGDVDLSAGKASKTIASSMLGGLKLVLGKDVSRKGVSGIFNSSLGGLGTKKQLLEIGIAANDPGIDNPTFADVFTAAEAQRANQLVRLSAVGDALSYGAAITAATSTVLSLISAGVSLDNPDTAQILNYVNGALNVIARTLALAATGIAIKVKLALSSLKTVLNQADEISGSNVIFLVAGIAIGLGYFVYEVVASGLDFVSLEFNQLLADFIAKVAVTILLFVISAVPIVGQLIAAIIGIIDAIVTFICSLVPESADTEVGGTFRDYLCGGITGLLTKLVAWFIYDQNPIVDLTHDKRLNITNVDFELENPAVGFQSGNGLTVTLDIETALYYPEFTFEDFSLFSTYRWMFNEINLRRTTLLYQFSNELPITPTTGAMASQWQAVPTTPSDNFFAPEATFYTVVQMGPRSFPLEPGINSALRAGVTERQAFKVQECSIPGVCWVRDDDDQLTIPLGGFYTFDVFPATVDQFRAIEPADAGQFKLAWDIKFDPLADADGDGLRAAVLGGADPDDSTPDTDRDGLSDFYELQVTNTDPLLRDTDNDGLCDGQEQIYLTDPTRADSDGDGLLDGEEVYHPDLCDGDGDADTDEWVGGWLFVYAYDGSVPQRVRVTSDPNSADLDRDQYNDFQERLYGFNPNVPSSGDILNIDSVVSDAVLPAGGTIDYQVQLENALDTSFALGLLDVDFNAAISAETVPPQPFNVRPQEVEQTNGQVTIRNDIVQSQIVSMTNVAGASIINPIEAVGGRSLWLQFNEAAGAMTFTDSSLNAYTFNCIIGPCPTAIDDGYRGNAAQVRATGAWVEGGNLGQMGLDSSGFTIDVWMRPDNNSQASMINFGGFEFYLHYRELFFRNGTDVLVVSGEIMEVNRWMRITLRYQNGVLTLFANGVQIDQTTADLDDALTAIADLPFMIGSNYEGLSGFPDIDELSIYPTPLTDSQIAALANERIFYLNGANVPESEGETSFDDSPFRNRLTCRIQPPGQCPQSTSNPFIADSGYIGEGVFAFRDDDEYGVYLVEGETNFDLSLNGGQFTIAVWADAETGSSFGDGDLLGDRFEAQFPFLYVSRNSGGGDFASITVEVVIEDESGQRCQYNSFHTVEQNRPWQHIVATFDGTSITTYVDGEPTLGNYTGGGSDCGGIRPAGANHFILGGGGTYDPVNDTIDVGQQFVGRFDELQIFNHVRTPEQIDDLYWEEKPLLDLRLDDPPTTTRFEDLSLQQFDVTCSGDRCPLAGLPGRDNHALRLDGVDDELRMPTLAQLELVDDGFTLAGWVRPDNIHFASLFKSTSNDLFLGSGNGTGVPLAVINGTQLEGATPLTVGRWTHLALRYDPVNVNSSTDDMLTLFVDGNAVDSEQGVVPTLDSTAVLVAGTYLGSGQPPLSGLLDRLQIFRDPLSEDEIARLLTQVPILNLHLDDERGAVTATNDTPLTATTTANLSNFGTQGRMYGSAVFSADSADRIDINEPVGADPLSLQQFTVGLWVQPVAMRDEFQTLITKQESGEISFDLQIGLSSFRLVAIIFDVNCTNPSILVSANGLAQNSWNHVVMSYDGDTVRLYINGALDTIQPGPVGNDICAASNTIYLGENSSGQEQFSGQLDEVLLYPSVLSDDDIRRLFNFQAGWYDIAVEQRITIDVDDPLILVKTPTAIVRDEERIVAIVATDPTSEIERVEYRVDGGAWQPAVADVEAWLFTFQPSGNGTYTIDARAFDAAGNMATDTGATIRVDGTGPDLLPMNVEQTTVLPIRLNWRTRDWQLAISGDVSPTTTLEPVRMASGEVAIFSDSQEPISGWQPVNVTGDSWEVDYPFVARPNGLYTVTIQAVDAIGNQSSRSAQVALDGKPPFGRYIPPSPNDFYIIIGSQISGTVEETGAISSGVAALDVAFHVEDAHDDSGVFYLPDGNTAHFTLDETFDPAAGLQPQFADRINGNLLTCLHCPATSDSGMIGGAPTFDGVDDALHSADLGTALTGGAFSIGGWVLPNSDGTLFNLSAGDYVIRYEAGAFVVDYAGAVATTAASFAADQWHHVMLVADPATDGQLYINGIAQLTFAVPHAPGANSSLVVGTQLAGQIDDIALYERALSAEEVALVMQPGYPALHLSFDELVISQNDIVQDDSRAKRTVQLTSGMIDPIEGVVGSLAFNGTGTLATDAVDLSHGHFTLMTWLRPEGATGTLLAGENGASAAYILLEYVNSAQLNIAFVDGANRIEYTTSNILTTDVWQHVGVTFDGTTLHIYVDGVLVDTSDAFNGERPVYDPATALHIGQATLDDVQIVRQVYSADQIMQEVAKRWQATLLATRAVSTTWSFTVPQIPTNTYELRLRTRDTNGNVSYDFNELPTATVIVYPDAPLAVDDVVTTDEDTAIQIDLLANDRNFDKQNATIALSTIVSGTAILQGDNTVLFTPDLNFNGVTRFTYQVDDNQRVLTNPASVTVNVTPINDAPVADDDEAMTEVETPITVAVLENDADVDQGDVLSVVAVGSASNGSVTFTSNGVTYTPTVSFIGTDTFTYTVSDGSLSDIGTVDVTVQDKTSVTLQTLSSASIGHTVVTWMFVLLLLTVAGIYKNRATRHKCKGEGYSQ